MTWRNRGPAPPGQGGRARTDIGSTSTAQHRPPLPSVQDADPLRHEWANRPYLNQRAVDYLAALGISTEAQIRAGNVWLQKATTFGRVFRPDPCGRPLVFLPVWSGAPDTIYTAPEDPWINDFVAFDGAEPGRWWYRTGAGGVLGEDLFDLALETGEAITVHPNPLAWLRSDCRGCCLLEELEFRYRLFWSEAA